MSSVRNPFERRNPLQAAALALKEMTGKLDRLEADRNEPIAIIGMGCRFPGGANRPAALWHLLREGRDAVREIPKSRWNVDDYYNPDTEVAGTMCTREGGFLDDIDRFDAAFFGISPPEALTLDPQQRLLLEVGWHALEDAAIPPHELQGSNTGVFVGVSYNTYGRRVEAGGAGRLDASYVTGNSLNGCAGRISYVLGLQGPSVAIDTACSSSLVAFHLACQSLRSGESELALAGGVNLILSPEIHIALSRARMIAPDGRCKTFDASADGYGRGEGCGIVVLKRLRDARENGDRIVALVRGSAMNQDGAGSSFMLPNGDAQQAVIRRALSGARVHPGQVQFVETHGTGTVLGDLTEVEALSAAYSEGRPPGQPLRIGSIKANLGHMESAAGIGAIIKVALALQNEQLPPQVHFKDPNPNIPWAKLCTEVCRELSPWPRGIDPRFAGVSAFGITGTNAHVILQEAPAESASPRYAERPLHVLPLSAKSDAALQQVINEWDGHLAATADNDFADACYTAGAGRSHFGHRWAAVTEDRLAARQLIEDWRAGGSSLEVGNQRPPKIAFLFSGPGSQYAGMGKSLYDAQPLFRSVLDQCDDLYRKRTGSSILPVIFASAGARDALAEVSWARPALFILEYALFRLWESWGVRPDAAFGHSTGEYSAACAAGVFSLEDGIRIVAASGRLTEESLNFSAPTTPLISGVTGDWVDSGICTPEYWLEHILKPVSFARGMETLAAAGFDVFLEIGPSPTLLSLGRTAVNRDAAWLPSLSPGRDDWRQMLESLASLYVKGANVDWQGFDHPYAHRRRGAPGYPFARESHWLKTPGQALVQK